MMLDRDVVAVSPIQRLPRALQAAGRLGRWTRKPSRKGTGFVQPLEPHEHWHIDVAYINICGTFYYLCSVLDGYSRVHRPLGDPRVDDRGRRGDHPAAGPREVPRRPAADHLRQRPAVHRPRTSRSSSACGMTHVRTSPYYPQSNGKLERWHETLKGECIRPGHAARLEDARRLVARFVEHYNTVRLHSAIGYVTPADKLAGPGGRRSSPSATAASTRPASDAASSARKPASRTPRDPSPHLPQPATYPLGDPRKPDHHPSRPLPSSVSSTPDRLLHAEPIHSHLPVLRHRRAA